MQIRRKIMNEMKGQPRLQKALAFAIFLKFKLGRSSLMRNYSTNKIHTLTGISATTINKYLPVLIEHVITIIKITRFYFFVMMLF